MIFEIITYHFPFPFPLSKPFHIAFLALFQILLDLICMFKPLVVPSGWGFQSKGMEVWTPGGSLVTIDKNVTDSGDGMDDIV